MVVFVGRVGLGPQDEHGAVPEHDALLVAAVATPDLRGVLAAFGILYLSDVIVHLQCTLSFGIRYIYIYIYTHYIYIYIFVYMSALYSELLHSDFFGIRSLPELRSTRTRWLPRDTERMREPGL